MVTRGVDKYKMVYHFEENPSLEMPVDASGSGHHITERYGTWIEGDGHTDYGKIGKGLHYNDDGSAEGKKTRNSDYTFTGDSITISGWIYTTDNWEPLFHSYVAGEQNGLYVPQAHQGSNASTNYGFKHRIVRCGGNHSQCHMIHGSTMHSCLIGLDRRCITITMGKAPL